MSQININCAFDGGNIVVRNADDFGDIRLAIRKDNASDFFQWFYFRLTGAQGQACQIVIENAGEAAYTGGWEDYQACASYDRETWFRVPTHFENGQLLIAHMPELDSIYYAYFAPYPLDRHMDLIAQSLEHTEVSLNVIGQSIEGRSLDCVSIGYGDKNIWVIARQHPGETMAEWWMEGFMARLLDDDDPVSRLLRTKARLHIIPNMNPDGGFNGNLRTNFAGANLNREWGKATIDHCPEVYHTIRAMNANRPDLVLDVHGDEALPYNFIAASEGIPNFTDKQAANLETFLSAYKISSPDFQTKVGYPKAKPGKGNLTMCTNWTAHEYDCLSMTLEMPFKDNADLPDSVFGWSPERAIKLGAATLDPMLAVVDKL